MVYFGTIAVVCSIFRISCAISSPYNFSPVNLRQLSFHGPVSDNPIGRHSLERAL